MNKAGMKMIFVVISLWLMGSLPAFSHCEIPCGIYDDRARIQMMAEHVTTIEKSMEAILTLSEEEKENFNQIVRWVNNKEHHAEAIQHSVSQYFLTQRVKPVTAADTPEYKKYIEQVTVLHSIMIGAMKAKQTTDVSIAGKLRADIQVFERIYFSEGEAGE